MNGRTIATQAVPTQTTLLDFLRAQGLTGAKEGCAEGECGACTVVVVAGRGQGSAYRAVNSCLMFLPMVDGQEIYTVESLASNGELAPVQKAMAAAGGSQCGYCTPGFVMSLFAEQYRPDRAGPCDPHALGGNLCRCTGYRPIRDAALSLGPPPPGPFLDRLAHPAPGVGPLKYQCDGASFFRPSSIDECLEAMGRNPEARLISGGTDLGVESNLRGRRWPALISLEGVAELREFSETSVGVTIGAGLPLSEIAALWPTAPAVVREWLPLFASPTLRNRATLGGNLATASPIGDGAPLLIAFDATLHIAGPAGMRRTVPVASFFQDYRRTLLAPGELLTAVEIPKPWPSCMRFYKVAKRRMDDISTVAAGMAIELDESGCVLRSRFAFGGVAAIPLRVVEAEEAILGQPWNHAAVARVQAVLENTLKPLSDHRGSAEYRLAVASSLVEKFWWEKSGGAA